MRPLGPPPVHPSMRYTILITMILLVGCSAEEAGPETTTPQSPSRDIHGAPVPPPRDGHVARAVIFITTDCPIANAYAPEIGRIVEEYGDQISFLLVHVDPEITDEAARQHQADYSLPSPIVLDPGHDLAGSAGITVTPEVAVYRQSDGELAYRGRIDDLFPELGSKRFAASEMDLRNALDAIVANEPVPVARTQAIGCQLPDPR